MRLSTLQLPVANRLRIGASHRPIFRFDHLLEQLREPSKNHIFTFTRLLEGRPMSRQIKRYME